MIYCAAFDCNSDSRYTTSIPTTAFRGMKLYDLSVWQRSHERISSFRKTPGCAQHISQLPASNETWKQKFLVWNPDLRLNMVQYPRFFGIVDHRKDFDYHRLSNVQKRKPEKRKLNRELLSYSWLGLLQTPKAAHHWCMIDRKIERWMLFVGNNNLYLKGVSPD